MQSFTRRARVRLMQLSHQATGEAGVKSGAPRLDKAEVGSAAFAESFPGGYCCTAEEEILGGGPESPVGLMGEGYHHTATSWGVALGIGGLTPGSSVPSDLTSGGHVKVTGGMADGDVDEEIRKFANPIGPDVQDCIHGVGHLRD